MSFKKWILAHIREDSAIGDIARDLKADKCCLAWSPKGIREHIMAVHGACNSALEALEEAERAYALMNE